MIIHHLPNVKDNLATINTYRTRHLPEGYLRYLPASKPPLDDELLSCWLIRLAHSHLLKAHSFTKILWPDIEIWNRDIDLNPNPILIKSLSEITCYSEAVIHNTTLQAYNGVLFNNNISTIASAQWILSLSKYHRIIRNKAILFCPSCLENDGINPYFRKKWRLAISFCCPKCNLKLQDCCPECKKPVSFIRNEIGRKSKLSEQPISYCSYCNFNLCKAPRLVPSFNEIKLQLELNSALDGEQISNHIPFDYFQVLHYLSYMITSRSKLFEKIITGIYSEFNIANHIERENTSKRFEFNPLEYRIQILEMANWLISNWPSNFISFFTRMGIHSSLLLKDFHELPNWYRNTVMDNFYLSNEMRAHPK